MQQIDIAPVSSLPGGLNGAEVVHAFLGAVNYDEA